MSKVKILFDISSLESGYKKDSGRTGIFFTSLNLFYHFLKNSNVEVYVYSNILSYYKAYSYVNECMFDELLSNEDNKELFKISVLDNHNKLIKKSKKIIELSEKISKENSLLKKYFYKVRRKFNYLSGIIENRDFYKKIDEEFVFFSPVYSVPEYLRKTSMKKVVMLYDTIPLIFPENYSNVKDFWYNKLLNSLNKDDYYICISDCTRQDFLKLNKIDENKAYTVYLAAGENFYKETNIEKMKQVKKKYGIPEGVEYIYSLSSLEPRKNLIFAVNNFIEFIEKNRIENLYMVLSGAVWDIFKNKIEEQVPKYSMYKDKIIQTGYVLDEDLSSLFSGAKFFVYPSLYEGFGLPVLEAMKCGTAVITSNVSSLPEVGGDAVYYINPKDNESLIKAYEEMYYNNDMREKFKAKALKHSDKFSWEKSVNNIINIIKNEIMYKK